MTNEDGLIETKEEDAKITILYGSGEGRSFERVPLHFEPELVNILKHLAPKCELSLETLIGVIAINSFVHYEDVPHDLTAGPSSKN
jgi:hypothetical protein